MGCAGSNPMPTGDTMTASNGHAAAIDDPMSMADATDQKSCSIVQKVIGSVNMDEMIHKIQDVTGSVENLMEETQEKICSFFEKSEQDTADDIGKTVEDEINNSTSSMPEKPKINEVIIFMEEETKIIPIDTLKSEILNNGKSGIEKITNEIKENPTAIITDDRQTEENEKQINVEEQKVEGEKDVKQKVIDEIVEESNIVDKNKEENKVEEEDIKDQDKKENKVKEEKVEEPKIEEEEEEKVEKTKVKEEEEKVEDTKIKKDEETIEETKVKEEEEEEEENEKEKKKILLQ